MVSVTWNYDGVIVRLTIVTNGTGGDKGDEK